MVGRIDGQEFGGCGVGGELVRRDKAGVGFAGRTVERLRRAWQVVLRVAWRRQASKFWFRSDVLGIEGSGWFNEHSRSLFFEVQIWWCLSK